MPYSRFLYSIVLVALLLGAPFTLALAVTPTPSPTPSGGQRTVSFRWNASTNGALGYKIYWGTGSGNYQNVRDVKNVLTTSLVLSNSTHYYVAVSAYDMMRESALSNEVIVPTAGSISW